MAAFWEKNKEGFSKQFSERSKQVWDRFFRCLNFDFNDKRNRGAVAARGVSRRAPERRAPQGGRGSHSLLKETRINVSWGQVGGHQAATVRTPMLLHHGKSISSRI